MNFLDRLGAFLGRRGVELIRGRLETCAVCGVTATVCCEIRPDAPPRCSLHCNHLDNEGRSLR